VADADTAADCIEQFAQLGMDAMRQQVANDYSPENYAATKKKLEEAEAAARERAAQADQRFKDELARAQAAPPGPGRWDEVARAGLDRTQARQDLQLARDANASAPCLAEQAVALNNHMAANGGQLPPMSGSVPGRGRPRY
jgi:hypothetical protein